MRKAASDLRKESPEHSWAVLGALDAIPPFQLRALPFRLNTRDERRCAVVRDSRSPCDLPGFAHGATVRCEAPLHYLAARARKRGGGWIDGTLVGEWQEVVDDQAGPSSVFFAGPPPIESDRG